MKHLIVGLSLSTAACTHQEVALATIEFGHGNFEIIVDGEFEKLNLESDDDFVFIEESSDILVHVYTCYECGDDMDPEYWVLQGVVENLCQDFDEKDCFWIYPSVD